MGVCPFAVGFSGARFGDGFWFTVSSLNTVYRDGYMIDGDIQYTTKYI